MAIPRVSRHLGTYLGSQQMTKTVVMGLPPYVHDTTSHIALKLVTKGGLYV
jgi:hypothetical protein